MKAKYSVYYRVDEGQEWICAGSYASRARADAAVLRYRMDGWEVELFCGLRRVEE